jgi:hypothetical protein
MRPDPAATINWIGCSDEFRHTDIGILSDFGSFSYAETQLHRTTGIKNGENPYYIGIGVIFYTSQYDLFSFPPSPAFRWRESFCLYLWWRDPPFRNPAGQKALFFRHQERLPMRPFRFHKPEALTPRRYGWNAVNT